MNGLESNPNQDSKGFADPAVDFVKTLQEKWDSICGYWHEAGPLLMDEKQTYLFRKDLQDLNSNLANLGFDPYVECTYKAEINLLMGLAYDANLTNGRSKCKLKYDQFESDYTMARQYYQEAGKQFNLVHVQIIRNRDIVKASPEFLERLIENQNLAERLHNEIVYSYAEEAHAKDS